MPLNEGVALCLGTFFIASFAFNLLLEAIAHKRRLIHSDLDDQVLSPVRKDYRVGLLVYGVSIAIAWNAGAGLLVRMSLWVIWTRLCYHPLRRH